MAQYTQTSTTLGALSSVAAGSWVAIPKGSNQQASGGGAGPLVVIVATSVTTGGTVQIEGRVTSYAGNTATKILHVAAITANGNTIIPLRDLLDNGVMPEEVRINCTARTDGTYTGAVLTAA